METYELQQQFFNHLKSVMPSHLSLVDELADLLGLSYDSIYRRIRGEKPITLTEIKLICEKYNISLDQVLQLRSSTVVFSAPEINNYQLSFPEYLSGILDQLKYFNSADKKQMWYLCKDAIFWQFYLFPEIAAFKTFFWIKSIRNNPEYNNRQFSIAKYAFRDCFDIGQQICKQYNCIPGSELWNLESFNSTISQIKYYKDAEIFENKEDLAIVVDSFLKMVDHLQLQAEKGIKFMPGAGETTYGSPFRLYINEVILGNNTIVTEMDGHLIGFVNYRVLSYIITRDQRFNNHVLDNYRTLESRSTLISGTGEKDRNKYFRSLRDRIELLKK